MVQAASLSSRGLFWRRGVRGAWRLRVCVVAARRGVAVLDVSGERVTESVPVEVVAVFADELVDRAEGALDAVEEARVGRGRDELDVVGLGEGADLRRPVAGKAVLDPVEPDLFGVGESDLLHERQRSRRRFGAAVV